jgi:two-component system response regulator FixJ
MPEATHRRTVFIVDDDAAVRDALSLLLSLRGFATAVFGSAEDFLGVVSPAWRGCVVADIRMQGMSGLAMQQALAERAPALPVIIVTAHGDIAAARQAFKSAAVDFFEKPFDDQLLVAAIERAMHALPASARATVPRHVTLSPREREVMNSVVAGLDNKSIGQQLGISPRTVEVHKARVLDKLGVGSVVELVKQVERGR